MDFSQYFNLAMVAVVFFLALLNERLVEWFLMPLVDPLFVKWNIPAKYKMYVALPTGILISLAASANVFTATLFPAEVGLGLTALLVGGGCNLLHQLIPPKSGIDAGGVGNRGSEERRRG